MTKEDEQKKLTKWTHDLSNSIVALKGMRNEIAGDDGLLKSVYDHSLQSLSSILTDMEKQIPSKNGDGGQHA